MFDGTFKNVALMVALLCVIAFTAIGSQYRGLVEVKVGGPLGGQLTIDGRQPPDVLK